MYSCRTMDGRGRRPLVAGDGRRDAESSKARTSSGNFGGSRKIVAAIDQFRLCIATPRQEQ